MKYNKVNYTRIKKNIQNTVPLSKLYVSADTIIPSNCYTVLCAHCQFRVVDGTTLKTSTACRSHMKWTTLQSPGHWFSTVPTEQNQ